ncbi:MAG TPA: O-antigen ligase family protein [Adhaeribacter sp.]|nr:O-antigen ligase family protein [Adhaeribacter sp.]
MLYLAWFFFFCSLPWFKAFASVAEVALLILTFATGGFKHLKPTVLKYWPVAAITLFFGALVAGLLFTQDLSNGWRVLKHQHRYLVIPLIFLANAPLLQKHFRQYLLSYILATTAAGLFVVLLYFLPEDLVRNLANSTKLMRPYPTMADRTAFGLYSPFIDRLQFSSLTAIAILSSFYLIATGYSRRLLLAALPILFYTMLILGGRSAQLALFAALAVYALAIGLGYLAPKLKERRGTVAATLILTSAGLVIFGLLPYLSFKLLEPVQNRLNQTTWEIEQLQSGNYKQYDYEHFTTFRRLVSVKNMWEVVQQAPLLGIGTGDYHPEIKKVYAQNNPEMEVNSHSQYLMYWAMTGLWGLVLFLGILFYWVNSLRRNRQLYFFGLAFLVFYLVNMLPDSVLYTQVDSMAFCSFLAFIGLQRSPSPFSAERKSENA